MNCADQAWLDELFEFLRIPSVSADPAQTASVRQAGEWVCGFVHRLGGTCDLVPTSGHPIVVGDIDASPGLRSKNTPTVLIYGHYDVQPPGDLEDWESPPFEPEVRDGWIYGRGAADAKGQLFLVLKAVEMLARQDRLPVNIRVLSDGDEEINADTVVNFISRDERGADACLVVNHPMPSRGVPFFVIGTRGLLFYRVRVSTGDHGLHSGIYGGVALSATEALMRVLAAVVSVPDELRTGSLPPSADESRSWRQLEPGGSILEAHAVAPADERAVDEYYQRLYAAPAVTVHALRSGDTRIEAHILPVEAEATVSIRLAPGQDPHEIDKTFQRLLSDAAPPGLDLEVDRLSSSPPGYIASDSAAIRLASEAFERVLGRRPLLVRTGGTLPLFPALAQKAIPVVFTGFDVPEGNIHAPNERFTIDHLPLGVEAVKETLRAFAALEPGQI